jgi:uncharacterized protein
LRTEAAGFQTLASSYKLQAQALRCKIHPARRDKLQTSNFKPPTSNFKPPTPLPNDSLQLLLLLCLAAFAAGFIDSIAGGGGLIQTPAMLILLPNLPVATLFGTVKIPSFCGTSFAAWQYARRVDINWKLLGSISVVAFIGALSGSRLVSLLPNQFMKPVVLCLLVAVAIYTWRKKDFGATPQRNFSHRNPYLYGIAAGAVLGFYDGFFGPGMGSFMIMAFIGLLGYDFLHASASAKVVNLATNLGAIVYFSASGNILYQYAIPMSVCNILGSLLGTRMALLRGNRFVRKLFLLVICATILRFAYDLFLK